MQKLKDQVRYSIHLKFTILIITVILFVSTSLVLLFIVSAKHAFEKKIIRLGISETRSTAGLVQYGVLTKNKPIIDQIIKEIALEDDIVYIEVLDNDNNILSDYRSDKYTILYKDDSSTIELESGIRCSSLSLNDNSRAYEFSSPILTAKIADKEIENELSSIMMSNTIRKDQYVQSQIGTINIAFSLEYLNKEMARFLSICILIVSIVVAVSTLLSIYFTNMISRPIRKVANTAMEIAEGNLSKRVKVKSEDEIGILARNFNKMSSIVQKNINELKSEIVERKIAEEELQSSKRLLQSIIDNTAAVIYLKDLNKQYILVNKRYLNVFNITREQIIGKTDYDIFPKETADNVRMNDIKVLVEMKPLEIEEVVPHKDGFHTYISLKFPFFKENGKPYGVCGISTDITKQKMASEALRKLPGKILSAQEHERKRISRDLHDGLGQMLVATKLKLGIIEKEVINNIPVNAKDLSRINLQFNEALNELRNIMRDLRPSFFEEMSIGDIISWHCRTIQDNINTKIIVQIDSTIETDTKTKDNLYRICQESINNSYKHSGGDTIWVTLKYNFNRSHIILTVIDNGNGIDNIESQFTNTGNGLGLLTIRERTELLSGNCNISSSPEKGTVISIEVPI